MKQTKNEKEQKTAKQAKDEEKMEANAVQTEELSEEELEEQRRRNFLAFYKWAYLQIAEGHLMGLSEIIEETSEIYGKWHYVLNNFKKKGFITEFSILNVNADYSKVVYKFNPQNIAYENDYRRLERKAKIFSLGIVPTGELVNNKTMDDVDRADLGDKNNEQVEKLDIEDSCVVPLNRGLKEDLKAAG